MTPGPGTEQAEKIRQIVRQFAKTNREPAPDESLFDSGILDSFSLPDMVSSLEEAFNIRIPDSDLNPQQFETLAQIEAYLNSRL